MIRFILARASASEDGSRRKKEAKALRNEEKPYRKELHFSAERGTILQRNVFPDISGNPNNGATKSYFVRRRAPEDT